MLSITYNSKKLYINIALLKQRIKKAFLKALIILFVISPLMYISVDLCRYPEKYVNTWKYQLYNDIQSGEQKAIDYYNNNYVSKGVYLYGEDTEPESDFLNLATVIDFEATEHGVLLHTEDGNGYFIAR